MVEHSPTVLALKSSLTYLISQNGTTPEVTRPYDLIFSGGLCRLCRLYFSHFKPNHSCAGIVLTIAAVLATIIPQFFFLHEMTSLTLSSASCNLNKKCAAWRAVKIEALIYMQIRNKYNLLCREHGLNKPYRFLRKDRWKPQTALLDVMQLLAERFLSIFTYSHVILITWMDPVTGLYLFLNRWQGIFANFFFLCPHDLTELPMWEPVCWLLLWPSPRVI